MDLIFDTHTHYDDEAFDADRDELIASLPLNGVGLVLNASSNMRSSMATAALAKRYSFVYGAVGIHPHDAKDFHREDLDALKKLAEDKKIVAIGEIGLDYHYDFSPREVQKNVFERQLELAGELDLPVVIHDREAHGDTMELLRKHRPKGVVHCFSGSVEMARETVALGMYIALGGAVTFKNAKTPVEVAAAAPEDRLLLETDCPYMTPAPNRGKRNSSLYLGDVARRIAEIRGVTTKSVISFTAQNGKRLFGIT